MSRESKLFKNTMIIAIGNICTKCISFFMLPLYTSILSTSEYGTVDLIGTYASLFTIILTLQFEQGVFRYLVDVRNNKGKQSQYITATILSCTGVLILFNLAAVFFLERYDYQYTYYFVVIASLNTINALCLQIPRGLGDNALFVIGSFLNGSFNVIFNVLFVAIMRWNIEGMLYANILSTAVSLTYITIKIKLWRFIGWKWTSKTCLLELIKYSFPLIPYTLCWWIIGVSDRVIIKYFLGVSFNGIYAASNKFPSLYSMVTNMFQVAWTESAAENVEKEDRDLYYNRVFEKTILFYSSANLFIIAVMPFMFSVMIGDSFKEAYYYIPILLTGSMFHSVAALYGSIYFAFKNTKGISTTTVLAAIVNGGINVILIKHIGLYAAAISTLLSYLLITLIRYFDVKKMVEIKLKNKYLLQEAIIYLMVFSSYYLKNIGISIFILVFVCVHCLLRNRDIILSIFNTIVNRKGNK